jgi:rhamnosyltransferase
MRLNTMTKRAAIYFFFDKEGIVDDYVPYQLNELRKNVDLLIMVSNGRLMPEGKAKVAGTVDEVLERENEGFDVWAYKTAIEHIGWDTLKDYDELVLMNFTVFGPLFPLSEVFAWADSQDIDFWGITKHYSMPQHPFGKNFAYKHLPEHIQSYFLAVRQPLLTSDAHISYWQDMPKVLSYMDSICYHECRFTQLFRDKGYSFDVFVDADELSEATGYPLMFKPLETVRDKRSPFVKRKSFALECWAQLPWTFGETGQDLLRHIAGSTDYDTDLIWGNILREQNMADIKDTCHLVRVLPRSLTSPGIAPSASRTLLVAHLYYKDQVENAMRYISHTPQSFDLLLNITDPATEDLVIAAKEKFDIKNKMEVQIIENRGRDVSSLLVGAADVIKNYDLVFFVHDKKVMQLRPISLGLSWQHKCFENLLASREYIENIVKLFETEPRLGMAFPPPPYTAYAYAALMGEEWVGNYDAVKEMLDRYGVRVSCREDKPPIAPIGTVFVFRPAAIEKLMAGPLGKGWTYGDFPEEPCKHDGTLLHAIERAYPFFVQDAGYYVSWLLNDEYVRVEIDNYYRGWWRCKKDVDELKDSNSWKITAPLRALSTLRK